MSVSQDRALTRRLVVSRLALDEAGTVETVHVRIAAAAAGVAPRTIWRWLAIARESGRVEPQRRRGGFAFTDELWSRLSDVGANVKALHRWMQEHTDEVLPILGTHTLPSSTMRHHAVHREQRAGRVLEISRPAHARRDPDRYDRALAEPALPGTVDEACRTAGEHTPATAGTDPAATRPSPSAGDARLYAPGAHPVSTRQL
ncbi:hypothetical protein ABIA38_009166, partial [Embleya sp. AB8]